MAPTTKLPLVPAVETSKAPPVAGVPAAVRILPRYSDAPPEPVINRAPMVVIAAKPVSPVDFRWTAPEVSA